MRDINKQRIRKAAEKAAILLALLGLMTVPGSSQNAPAHATAARRAPHARRVILVSIPDRKLALLEDGRILKIYRVAVGAKVSPSPIGEFEVINRIPNATYYHEGVVIPAGDDSPIGTRWIGLNNQHYGIHGTNDPRSVGRLASHGCIRLRNRDVEQLFKLVRVGDKVQIRADRDDELAEIFGSDSVGRRVLTASTAATVAQAPARTAIGQ